MSSTLFLAAILGALPPPGPAAAQDQWTSRSHSFAQEIKITRQAIKRRDPSALARIYRLWNTAALTESVTELNEELKSLLKIRRTDPLVKDHLHYMLKDLAHNNGELDVVKNHTAQLGLATDGWIIGPFENAGNSGHAQSYPPETSFEPQLVLPGKSHPVQWRRIKGLAPHGEVMLAHMVMPNTGATAYGLFALTADKTEKAALRVGASAQVKIFYDGELIYEFDGARGPDFDQINIPLLISKGAHRLLIKSSWVLSKLSTVMAK